MVVVGMQKEEPWDQWKIDPSQAREAGALLLAASAPSWHWLPKVGSLTFGGTPFAVHMWQLLQICIGQQELVLGVDGGHGQTAETGRLVEYVGGHVAWHCLRAAQKADREAAG
jgi:hypothetical protein